ncbi:MAG: hypothetical protein JW951_07340, partial [Lentisphaerae bacterium]|nr:hypothetical protein [Lentisphaerota bacterium]
NFGDPYVPYYRAMNAFEINWRGEVMDTQGRTGWRTLWGRGHAVAMPSAAFRTAWSTLAKSSMRWGHAGVGFTDMVWFWPGGRGRSGHHPETIAAFRRDLAGLDEGLVVHTGQNAFRTFHVRDYADYYFGGMPEPADLGFASWAEYSPLTYQQYTNNPPDNLVQHYALFDTLVHYEWLKAAQTIGRVARAEGGMFQCMGNPEDMANGADTFFASRLRDVGAVGEEYFKNPRYLDGTYHRYPYLTSRRHDDLQVGLVLEGGHGGNDWPYYADELAYAIAYESSLAVAADHLEADFWPSQDLPLAELRQSEFLRLRMRQILSFGLGFRHAYEDGARRVPPDVLSVTSRAIFRPWGTEWKLWSYMLQHLDTTPDPALAQSGFSFACLGEDGLGRLDGEHAALLYTADPPTEQGFDRLLERVRAGQIRNAILSAPALSNVVTRAMRLRPLAELYPAFAFASASNAVWRAPLTDLAGGTAAAGADAVEIHGPLFSSLGNADTLLACGDRPIAVARPEGRGRLIVLLFDPSLDANAAAAQAVYGRLLEQLGIAPRWRAGPGAVARLYQQGDLLIAGVQNEAARDWDRKIIRPNNKGHYVPYDVPGAASRVELRLAPGASYRWAMLPRGETGVSTADAAGWAPLAFTGTSHEIFFLLPESEENRERVNAIAARRTVFEDMLRRTAPVSVRSRVE